ncbi:hypothetical protein Pmani_010703 [Petrolisthes manimaculis]|uniref:Uncharacterized protein n=1 Tax=Petrolisthes manimaculis TaxID=1843537 RepID=A0AAE1Q1N0_9EUCA|nr:hypothetical protein Pmani_010703 [Petrolisthes manimaculis]
MSNIAGAVGASVYRSQPRRALHTYFIFGCVPLAFDQPRSPIKQWVHFLTVCSRSLMSSWTNLQGNGWVQWLAGTRACPHTAVPLGHTAAPRSPAGLAWSRKTPSYRV